MNKIQKTAIASMNTDEKAATRRRVDNEIYIRAEAVLQQGRRLRASDQTHVEYQADGWLLAEAIRAVLRAGELAVELREPHERDPIEGALRRVGKAFPDAVAVRDALEHFDDYLLGLGRRHTAGASPLSYGQQSTRKEPLEIRVGPWILNVTAAEQAAGHLASVILAGRDYLNLLSDEP